ncbi:MAG TPA: type II secretion system secretin GspD [Gallionellaceae bacterium]|nr:type II secretion system secretin GspD [Gallionellaceae bacterium]
MAPARCKSTLFRHTVALVMAAASALCLSLGALPAFSATPAGDAAPAAPDQQTQQTQQTQQAASTEQVTPGGADKTTLNFVNADIPEVIRAISHITKRNFLVDPKVKGTINIVSATPVSNQEAYNLLLSALRMQGYAAVEANGVTRIMPEANAKHYIARISGRSTRTDEIVTRIFPIQYQSATQLVNVLRPLIAPNNVVVAYPATNTLVVTDYASNLRRIAQIVHSLDQPTPEAPVVIPVQYLSAADLAQTINRLMQDTGAPADTSSRFVLLADVRSNVLLLRSNNPERIARVETLVKQLDVPTHAPGNIHVIYLKNAVATDLAQTLRGVLSGEIAAPAAAAGSSRTATGTTGATASAGASTTAAGSDEATIQADPASNSLIIVAPEAVYNNLRNVVDMLDVRRAQVFVEALIAEVNASKLAQFGIQWQSLSNASGASTQTRAFGGTNFVTRGAGGNILDASTNLGTVSQGLNVGVVKGQITIPGVGTILNLGALANALQQDADGNILSTPNLLTLDNEEAKIVVGQNVPFITGQYAQTGSTTTATPFQTIERKDVGLTLRIKPQISQGGAVKLNIYQEVSSVDAASLNNPAGIITNKRSLESSVLVDPGQTVVLGGLIEDQVTIGESKVPLLGDIPIIGALFRYRTRQHTKTNLMIFIRPHVLRDKDSAVSLTQERYDFMREQEANSKPPWDAILPNPKMPQLPPFGGVSAASAPVAASSPEAAGIAAIAHAADSAARAAAAASATNPVQ